MEDIPLVQLVAAEFQVMIFGLIISGLFPGSENI